ncbi:MAG: outer membrane protein [Myxococcota bacterium]|jgi:outer membrane protein
MIRITTLITASAFAITLLGASAASAQSVASKIGVVDLQRALLEVPDGKTAKGRLEKAANSKKRELEGKKKELEGMQEEFKRQGALLTEAVRREKMRTIQEKTMQLQRAAMQAEQELKAKEIKMLRPISEKLEKAVAKVAKEKGLVLVLHLGGTAYHAPATDITDAVIKAYGK